jgi:hypothetical protein
MDANADPEPPIAPLDVETMTDPDDTIRLDSVSYLAALADAQ